MSVVFAAGFLVPQQLAGLEYFRGAAAAFPGALFPPVPTLGDVPTRANDLANQINTAFPNSPIHIVAHSMAGLDSRFLLSKNLCGLANPGRVASLSMISTPHWGSPIADLLVASKPSVLDPRWITYESLVHLAAEFGLSLGALGDLTSSYAARFNPQNPDVPTVRYYCYAGSGMESFLLRPSHVYIDFVGQTPDERANDGLVSVKSASLSALAEEPWTTADHLSEVGYNLSSPTLTSAFDHIPAYRRILARARV
jgi:triacylglycerol lipase